MRCDVHLAVGHVGPSLEFVVGHDGRVSECIGLVSVGVSDNVVARREEEEERWVGPSYANEEERRGEGSSGSWCLFSCRRFSEL